MWDMIKKAFTTELTTDSKPGTINKNDMLKVMRDGLVAAGAALLSFLLTALPSMDFGKWDNIKVALAVPALTWLLSFVLRLTKDNSAKTTV